MMGEKKSKSLGQAIDEIVNALGGINANDQVVAIRAACEHLSLQSFFFDQSSQQNIGTHSQHTKPQHPQTEQFAHTQQQSIANDIRSLTDQKNPSSAREMACVVAYYLQNLAPESERKDVISSDDITKYFKQANYPLPSAISQLLKDAKGAGYFDSSERGAYKLNPVGYNLVAHGLPRDQKNGPSRRAKPKTTKRKTSLRKKKTKR